MFLFVECNAIDAGRIEGAGNHKLCVGSPSHDIDVFATQFVHDATKAAAFHTHASSYRVDTVVVALDSNLGAFTRDACNLVDCDEAVLNLRYFCFQHSLQELGSCSAQDDARLATSILDAQDDGTSAFALTEEIAWNLFLAGKEQFVAFLVHEKRLAFPCLIHFCTDDFSLAVFVLIVQSVVLQLHDSAGKGLSELKDGTASELGHVDELADFFANLVVLVNLLCFTQRDFLVLVVHFAIGNNHTIVVDLEVALVGIDDDVVVLVCAMHLGNDVAEAFFQHAYQSGTVDVVLFFKVGEHFYHVDWFSCLCFLCHFYVCFVFTSP